MVAGSYPEANKHSKAFNLIKYCCLLFFFLTQFNVSGHAQQFFKLHKGKKQYSLKFTFHRNLIILPVQVNDKGPFNFIIDTGLGIGLITNPRLLDSLGMEKGSRIYVTGAGSSIDELKAYQLPHTKLAIQGATANNVLLTGISEDIFNLSSFVGMPIDGILGYQFFSSFVVKFDFTTSTMTLYEPKTFKYKPSHGQQIPFELEDNKPYLRTLTTFSDNAQITSKLILDTGAGHALSLETNSNSNIQIPTPSIRALLGTGLNGSINGYIGRIKNINLGKYALNNVIASFPDHSDVGAKVNITDRNGNIGNDILKRFHVIIDYSRSLLTLKPNRNFKQPFEHDMGGLEVIAQGQNFNRFFVSRVVPGSPAAEGDIQKGDEIIFLNGSAGHTLDLNRIYNLFRLKENFRILLVLKRNGENIIRVVTLKRKI
ncbi:aspartyl protease family protein [Adhaeribacter aquaticus]|uniref:aspartyl protease family protein n=1 Tax=Adhaeribacter aquaticus TaxID=299567 RepID=UPI0003FF476B|nr:aspartyl protease family protein [Adhaeribacter aquaticus]